MRNLAYKLMICAFAATQLVSAKETWELNGDNYQTKSAAEKQSLIWQQVTADNTSNGWYGATGIAALFVEDMRPSLQYESDTMPTSWLGKRVKYIHSVGAVAQVKFVPVANNEGYTGIFETGCEHAIIRMSSAIQPDTTKTKAEQANGNLAPGFGLKFLVDGQPSKNIVTVTVHQDSWNFFKNDFQNGIPIPPEPLKSKLKTATEYIHHMGTGDISKHHTDGTVIENPQFPYLLVFSPPDELRTKFSDDYTKYFTEQLETIPAGTTLYKVMAVKESGAPRVHIGDIITTSEVTRSKYGDTTLFFKHQNPEEDVAVHPEWKDALNSGSVQASQPAGCPFEQFKSVMRNLIKNPLSMVELAKAHNGIQ
eukprot:403348710